MYLPLMAMAVAMVVAFSVRGVRHRVPRSVAALLLIIAAVALGTATIRRNTEHQSWSTLAQTTLDGQPMWRTQWSAASWRDSIATKKRSRCCVSAPGPTCARDTTSGITLFNSALRRSDRTARSARQRTSDARRGAKHAGHGTWTSSWTVARLDRAAPDDLGDDAERHEATASRRRAQQLWCRSRQAQKRSTRSHSFAPRSA